MSFIFISYSHKDCAYAQELAKRLENEGIDIWIDERIDYGTQWPRVIQEKLDQCDAFIVIMSPRSFSSDWVQNELSRAKEKKKMIFPLLLEGDGPWLSVQATQYIDVRNGKPPPLKFYHTLLKLLKNETNPISYGSPKASEVYFDFKLSLEEAYWGTTQIIHDHDRQVHAEVKIPRGVNTGTLVRLRNLQYKINSISVKQDVFARITVREHPLFTRRDDDLYIHLPIKEQYARIGCEAMLPLIDKKKVALVIPADTTGGTWIRLRGYGMPIAKSPDKRGDLFVEIQTYNEKDIPADIWYRLQTIFAAIQQTKIELNSK